MHIIYASAATKPFRQEDLQALLTTSRARNSLCGVGGMLLYDRGSFLQVLEGPREAVARIYASIVVDPRHTKTRLIARTKISTRDFTNWSMAFVDSSQVKADSHGHLDYSLLLPELTKSAGSAAYRYLRYFQEGLCHQHTQASQTD